MIKTSAELNITAENLISFFDETATDLAYINAKQTVRELLESRFEWEKHYAGAAGFFVQTVNVWQNANNRVIVDDNDRKLDDQALLRNCLETGAFLNICIMLNAQKETPEAHLTDHEIYIVRKMLIWASDRAYYESNKPE